MDVLTIETPMGRVRIIKDKNSIWYHLPAGMNGIEIKELKKKHNAKIQKFIDESKILKPKFI